MWESKVQHLYLLAHCNIYKPCSIASPEHHTPNISIVSIVYNTQRQNEAERLYFDIREFN